MLNRLRALRDRLRGGPDPSWSSAVAAHRPPPDEPLPAPPPAPTHPDCYPSDLDAVRTLMVPAGRPRIVNHWATWCHPCVDELPRLVQLATRLAGAADVVGISWDRFENPAAPEQVAQEVAAFAGRHGVPYPTAVFSGDPDQLFDGLGLEFRLIPQTFVLAADGTVVRHIQGVVTEADVAELLVELAPSADLASSAPAAR